MGRVAKRTIDGITCLVAFGAIDAGVPRGIDVVVRKAEASSSAEAMPSTMDMMKACSQMIAQMGGMGGMAPPAKTQAPETREPTEHGTKQAGGLEVTLVSTPPLSAEAMQRMMPGMSGGTQGMGGIQGGMGGMMGGKGMGGMMSGQGQGAPTHWIGVIVRDVKEDRVVQDLDITLTAKKGGLGWTAKLMPMPGSYGANISLPEKGLYTVTVTIVRPGQPVSVGFPFNHE